MRGSNSVSDMDLQMISSVRAVEITAFSSTGHITHIISQEEQKALLVTPPFFFSNDSDGMEYRSNSDERNNV